jgi:hypothetical protein
MAVATTDVAVASMALVLIGDDPISAFDGSTTGAIVAENIYDTVVADILTQHPWRFAVKQTDLSHLEATPEALFTDAWQIPTDALLIRRVIVSGSDITYEIYGDKIFANVDETNTVTANYIFRALEQDWPPYFLFAAQLQLASLFSMSVAGKPDMSQDFETKADFALRKARAIDSQSDTTHNIETTRFIDMRR